ncbi:hypothetical protein F7734_30050 [Scytonema sp. UIC 10036]|nr:hypothetical protein [Scytonema sp. UIC 10036]MUG96357.1 hypothetical protein [Scytonema sp. UIC 10036]
MFGILAIAWGNIWWSAYDPTTDRSIHNISEEEILVWIEHLYSRKEGF